MPPSCDDAIALQREIADLETDNDAAVIIEADANGRNDLTARIDAFPAATTSKGNPQ